MINRWVRSNFIPCPLVQKVIFSTKQVSSHLDIICPLKSTSKANLSNLPNFDHLNCVGNFSQMAIPNLVKLFPLKNILFKISYDSRIIKFGQEIRELWLIQSDPAVVIMHWSLGNLTHLKFTLLGNKWTTTLSQKYSLPILRWNLRQQLSKLKGTNLKVPSVQIYIVITLIYLITCFYIYNASLVSCVSYFSM